MTTIALPVTRTGVPATRAARITRCLCPQCAVDPDGEILLCTRHLPAAMERIRHAGIPASPERTDPR